MANIPPVPQLRIEELPKELQDPLTPFFAVLNQFMRSITQAMTRQLSIAQNFLGFDYTVAARTSEFPLAFTNKMNVKPKHVLCTRAVRLDPTTLEELAAVPCAVAWRVRQDGLIEASSPTNLSSGEMYRFTFLVLG
jgi:hypothetical protein